MCQACNFIKKETLAQVFSCEFCEISKNTFFTEHLQIITSLNFVQVHDKCTKSTLQNNYLTSAQNLHCRTTI